MVAPPYFTLPPRDYGGVEAIVADLVDGLVDRGHHVTLIGAGEHGTKAQRFVPTYADPVAHQIGESLPEMQHAAKVARILADLDVDLIHDHTLAGPLLARGRTVPTLVTTHGTVSGEPYEYYRALGDTVRLVGISASQCASAPDLPWLATVHNAIRVETFPHRSDKEDFVLFLGRLHPQKAPHLAIEAARGAGLPIVVAGKCSEPIERDYFDQEVVPRLGPDVTVFGLADGTAKRDLLSRAACVLFPIRWEEPFGLVMIEAMACGTPVVALRRGSVPEIIMDGHTGIVVDDPEDLADAVHRARRLDSLDCRAYVEKRFSTEAMTTGYEVAYRQLLAESNRSGPLPGAWPLDGWGPADPWPDSGGRLRLRAPIRRTSPLRGLGAPRPGAPRPGAPRPGAPRPGARLAHAGSRGRQLPRRVRSSFLSILPAAVSGIVSTVTTLSGSLKRATPRPAR